MWHNDEVGVFYHMNPTFPVESMTFANFDPVKIIDAAESVGAKHIVVVCKHVNGFQYLFLQIQNRAAEVVGSSTKKLLRRKP